MLANLTVKNYRCFADTDPLRFELRKGLTAFIGVNNSGKSSLLRFFYEFRSLFAVLSNGGDLASMIPGELHAFQKSDNVLDLQELFINTNDRDIEIDLDLLPEPQDGEPRPLRIAISVPRPTNTFRIKLFIDGRHDPTVMGYESTTGQLFRNGNTTDVVANVRGVLGVFSRLASTLYIGPFRNAVNIGANQNYFDIRIGQAFIAYWRESKTGSQKQRHKDVHKLTDDIKRIFDFNELEINASDNNQAMQLFVDGQSYFLSELGSGISHFILVLANAAFQKPSYILIDEPEMGLHPSLQLDFLTTLASYATDGVMFSTHSVGLAKSAAERIYSVKKTAGGAAQTSQFELTARLPEFLGELSFSGYQELGFDKILLVEGITEVKTIQQFLRKYGLAHKIVLMPLGGSQFINASRALELEELTRLSRNLFVVIDSERTNEGQPLAPDRQAFIDICERLAIRYLVLERRATENYLTERAVKAFKGADYRALGPFEALRAASPRWLKEENWRIASEMTRHELDETDLGNFLAAL